MIPDLFTYVIDKFTYSVAINPVDVNKSLMGFSNTISCGDEPIGILGEGKLLGVKPGGWVGISITSQFLSKIIDLHNILLFQGSDQTYHHWQILPRLPDQK